VVAGGNIVERRLPIAQYTDEYVDAARRALRIGASGDVIRQAETLLQLGDVHAAPLQDGPTAQIEFVHGDVGDSIGQGAAQPGKERRADAPGPRAEAQIETGRLHLIGVERARRGDGAVGDQRLDGLTR